MLLAFGTSHTQDMNHGSNQTDDVNQKYRRWGEDCWVKELGRLLNTESKNHGVSGVGMQTYFARITASLVHYPQTKFALIEIPSPYRIHFHVHPKKGKYSEFNPSQLEYWQLADRDNNSDLWKAPDYTKGHICLLNTHFAAMTEKELTQRFSGNRNKFNEVAEYLIEPSDIIGASRLMLKSYAPDHQIEIISHCIHIDGFLKYKNITPVWWVFTPELQEIIPNVVGHQQLKLLHDKPLPTWAEEKGWEFRNKKYYADGHHLNSDLLKIAANEYFYPNLKEIINE